MKRFYKNASVDERPGGTFAVLLDGRSLKTSQRRDVAAPTRGLAEAVAAEWQEAGEEIRLADMALTHFLSTALDTDEAMRAEMTGRILAYLDTDLLCYRAEKPEELVRRQREAWDPWLDWFGNLAGTRP